MSMPCPMCELPAPPAAPPLDYRAVVDALIVMGSELARVVHGQALATPATAANAIVAFDRIARCVRRTVLLARKLAEPWPAHAQHREAARRRIIRAVEDTIQRHGASDAEKGALHAEFLDRLDAPDLDEDIAHLPPAEIIADICRDLGLASPPGAHPWKRRTPHDIATLCARAAQAPPAAAMPRFREK